MIDELAVSGARRPYGTGPRDYPHVSTRGRYYASLLNSVRTRNPAEPFELNGDIPGTTTDPSPEELLVFVHGWLADHSGALGAFTATREAFQSADYHHPVVGYTWDSDTSLQQWCAATSIARRNGAHLAEFIEDYRQSNPHTTVRLVAHSLGSRVALEALEQLPSGTEIETVALLGAAADTHWASHQGRYGTAIQDNAGELHNFHKTTDSVLAWMYSFGGVRPALGQHGVHGDPPKNYHDHRVDHVSTHHTYFAAQGGCVPEVVETF